MKLICAAVGLLASCTGTLGDPGGGQSDSPNAPSPNTPAGSAIPSPDTSLRRLTRTEYNNTIRDLLGITTQPGNSLDPDPIANGLDNNADLMKVSVIDLDRYDLVADGIVETAFRAKSTSRKKLLGGCDPVAAACAPSAVARFGRRAWRRRLEKDELDALMTTLDDVAAAGGTLEDGVKVAIRTILLSPNFLYRVEIDGGAPNSRGLRPLGPFELATRLSYFLWASTPDDELLAAAEAGGAANLTRPDVFSAQLTRMFGDPKADALVSNFGAQWLRARGIDEVAPDPVKLHVNDFEALRPAIKAEALSFFEAFLKEDLNVADMLDARFTFVNDRLAKHYGLGSVTGTNMRKVPIDGSAEHRFGLLSQAGFLTVTSIPTRTVPTTRGKTVLSQLLCQAIPPKPAMVPPLSDVVKNAPLPPNPTIRQQMEVVDKNPCTGACHPIMDPIGFALEHYDAIGRWRDSYPTANIDATGHWGGDTFDGASELSKAIKADPRFVSCFVKTVFGYALGRDASAAGDQATADVLAADFVQGGGQMRDLFTKVAATNAFQFRGGQ